MENGMSLGNIGNEQKQSGINRVFKFGRVKTGKTYQTDKKELIRIEQDLKATVVKIEYTNFNCFVLFSNGKVVSKGKQDCLGRIIENGDFKTKKFGIIDFINKDTSENDENLYSAVIYNIHAGDEHVLALDNNGSVWAWGSNTYRQIHPKLNVEHVDKPKKLALPNDAKVSQMFAVQRSSMIICRGNIIYMWGCISEGYLGNFKDKKEHAIKEFLRMDKLSAYILNDIQKNNNDEERITDKFINSRKLFNTKYNQTLDDNDNKKAKIEKLNGQIRNLKAEIEARTKQNTSLYASLNAKSNDKRITLLQELLRTYEEKLNKISLNKDKLRKNLIGVEEEINQKDIDLKGITEEIDTVENKMESINNQVTEKKSQLSEDEDKNGKLTKEITELNKNLSNMRIYKESLMNNLQVIIVFLEDKEKERKEIANHILSLTDKENEFLKGRYTVEDMIQILQESLANSIANSSSNSNANDTMSSKIMGSGGGSQDKYKDKYLELFNYNDKLDKITFSQLDKIHPYKIIDDILDLSNKEVKVILKDLELTKSSMSDVVKDNLKIIFDMIETKVELVKEQNAMIKQIYTVFSNLKTEIIQRENYEQNLTKSILSSDSNNLTDGKDHNKTIVINRMEHDIEYYYKTLLLKFFEDVYKEGAHQEKILTNEEKIRLKKETDYYLQEKKVFIRKMEERSKENENCEVNSYKDIKSFGYTKEEAKSGSFFSWMGFSK